MKGKAPNVARNAKRDVFIVEDHPIFREGISRAVESEEDLFVCGYSSSAAGALDLIGKLHPDAAIVDISLPGRSGLELIKDLKMISPNTVSIVLSMHDEMLYAERALRAGARGYVMKLEDTATVIRAIREALAGKVFVSSKISEHLLMKFSGGMKKCAASIDQLSDRELDVLQLIGGGLGTPEIARQSHLSPKTVTVHKGRIKEKLALKTATEMIRFAVAWVDSSQKSAI